MSRTTYRKLVIGFIAFFTLLSGVLAWHGWTLSKEVQTLRQASLQAAPVDPGNSTASPAEAQQAEQELARAVPATPEPAPQGNSSANAGADPFDHTWRHVAPSGSWPSFPGITGMAGDPDPFQRFAEMQRDMDAFMRSMSGGLPMFDSLMAGSGFSPATAPQIILEETPTEFIVLVEKPAGSEIELNTEVSGNLLTISGRTSARQDLDNGSQLARSRHESHFSRSITLRQPVDELGMEIEYDDTTVRLRLPKA